MIVINDVLSNSLTDSLRNLALDVVLGRTKDAGLAVKTNYSWDSDIVLDSAPVLCIAIPDFLAEALEIELIKNNVLNPEEDESIVGTAMVYVWFKGSYIPPHGDMGFSKAVTLYLSPNWEPADGGMFIFKSAQTGGWEVVMPNFNTGVINNANEIHLVTPVQSSNNLRITAQIFIKPKQKTPTYLEYIK